MEIQLDGKNFEHVGERNSSQQEIQIEENSFQDTTNKKLQHENHKLRYNNKKVRQFNILLTQSQKLLDKNKIKQTKQVPVDSSSKLLGGHIPRDSLLKQLRLQKGSSFWSLKDDYQTIYNNFNLLSYFSSSWGIQILSRKQIQYKNKLAIQEQFILKRQLHCRMTILETYRDNFSDKGILRIQYEVIDYEKKLRRIQIFVQSQIRQLADPQQLLQHVRDRKKMVDNFRQFIKIKIIDVDGWIQEKRKYTYSRQRHHRVSELRKAKVWQTQYFYIEPNNQRHKIIQKEHLSLALQGGGCKGVQYIGAYRAILQNKKGIPITSVIGSSAGGIIGLAICCQLQPQQIIEVCVKLLSKVTNDKKYKSNEKEFMDQTFNEVVKFLKTINIFQQKIINMIVTWLRDEEFKSLFLKFLLANNNPQVYKLFIENQKKNGQDQLNMTGLFKAELMTGSIIRQIAVTCIATYVNTLFNSKTINSQIKQKLQKIKQKYSKYINQQKQQYTKFSYIGQNLTLSELYSLTGIQFTCTAVDIDNHILRFFNQKTTPNLPACYAVQMTGSFPVAFEAQTWKSEWGKYYIHYANFRKQIDLTGCRITDGGTLANFPVKYLDNEQMRPMYFSHAKTKDTVIYGLGLKTYIEETQAQKQMKKQANQNLSKYISEHISKGDIMGSWLKQKVTCCFKPQKKTINLSQNPFHNFASIPLIQFVLNLLQTYSISKDHLTQECFIHSSYQTIAGSSYVNEVNLRPTQRQLGKYIQELVLFIQQNIPVKKDDSLESICQCFLSNIKNFKQATIDNYLSENYLCQIQKNLYQNSTILLHSIQSHLNQNQKNKLIQKLNQQIKNSFDQNYCQNYVSQNYIDENDQECHIEHVFQLVRNMTKQKQFVLCSIQQDLKALQIIAHIFLSLSDSLQQIQVSNSRSSSIDSKKNSIFAKTLQQMRNQEYQQLQKIKVQLLKYAQLKRIINEENYNTIQYNQHNQQTQLKLVNISQSKNLKTNNISNLKKPFFVNRKIILLLSKLPNLTMTLPLKGIKKVVYQIKHCRIPQFFINFAAQDNRNLLKSYTLNRIVEDMIKVQKIGNDQKNNLIVSQNNMKSQVFKSNTKQDNFRGIHLVLESVPLSQMYFYEYYRIVKETILQYNEGIKKKAKQKEQSIEDSHIGHSQSQTEVFKQVKVTTMTATGYHCLIMFLYASDLPEERIAQQVWKIRDLIKLDQKDIIKKYENKDWAKITPILLRQFKSQAEKNKKDIYEQIRQINRNRNNNESIQNLTKNIRNQVNQVRFQNDEMNIAIQNSLNYIVSKVMVYENQNSEIGKTNDEKTRQLMSELVIDMPNQRYQQQNTQTSLQLKTLSNFFLQKFQDLLKYMFYESPRLVDKIINSLRPEERQIAWRGLILSQILSGKPIKDYVRSILKQVNFKPDTTLRQFYQYSQKKIQLNFSVVEETSVAIYNHISRPNIPVWAAILASAAIPEFYSPLITRPEWIQKFQLNYNKRQVQRYFKQAQSPYLLLTSSQTLTRLPLDLLLNNKLKPMITNNQDQIFLIFNFSQYALPSITQNLIQTLNIAPITLGQLVTKFVSFKKQIFGINSQTSQQAKNVKALGMLASLPSMRAKFQSLSLYIQSHDNLILKLYKAQLVQFPIRLDTLDFDKMTTVQNGKQRLSDICCDAIKYKNQENQKFSIKQVENLQIHVDLNHNNHINQII